MSVDEVFVTQMNAFVKVLSDGLGDKNGMVYGSMLIYTRARILMILVLLLLYRYYEYY